ncbi:MAG: type II secretion system protein [Candidatus Microsaccharimonas sp.]
MKCISRTSFKSGFTLVEMLVVAPIVILVIGTFVFAIVQFTGQAVAERNQTILLSNVQAALSEIEEDVRSSGAFLATNNTTLTSPQGLNDDTTPFTNVSATNDAIILNVYVTNQSPDSPTRSLSYLANVPNACGSSSITQNQAMTMNVVYFVKDDTLWRRTLAVSTYADKDCPGASIWQRPSCAVGQTDPICETQDERLVSGIKANGFTVNYYAAPSDVTPVTGTESGSDADRQTAMDGAPTVEITIQATGGGAGREYTQKGSIRVTRIGALVKYATPS